eukprot:Lankesteria_metandrocarpae@DN3797_c0_g1_i1.p1
MVVHPGYVVSGVQREYSTNGPKSSNPRGIHTLENSTAKPPSRTSSSTTTRPAAVLFSVQDSITQIMKQSPLETVGYAVVTSIIILAVYQYRRGGGRKSRGRHNTTAMLLSRRKSVRTSSMVTYLNMTAAAMDFVEQTVCAYSNTIGKTVGVVGSIKTKLFNLLQHFLCRDPGSDIQRIMAASEDLPSATAMDLMVAIRNTDATKYDKLCWSATTNEKGDGVHSISILSGHHVKGKHKGRRASQKQARYRQPTDMKSSATPNSYISDTKGTKMRVASNLDGRHDEQFVDGACTSRNIFEYFIETLLGSTL